MQEPRSTLWLITGSEDPCSLTRYPTRTRSSSLEYFHFSEFQIKSDRKHYKTVNPNKPKLWIFLCAKQIAKGFFFNRIEIELGIITWGRGKSVVLPLSATLVAESSSIFSRNPLVFTPLLYLVFLLKASEIFNCSWFSGLLRNQKLWFGLYLENQLVFDVSFFGREV